nr:peptidase family M48 family protein [Tanacetum cinerariifolium]
MAEELVALYQSQTWDLVPLLVGKRDIGSRWVYKIKTKPDGSIEIYKACLVSKIMLKNMCWAYSFVVSVDDMIIIGDDSVGIESLESELAHHFAMKDLGLQHLWDTCNNMVICWLIGYVNESIARSIMFIGTASEIWKQLEKSALSKQKEEQRLFQFLNGLDEHYNNQRSQILIIAPLPSMENACSILQQEESQRVLSGSLSVEYTPLLSKGKFQEKCLNCGFKWNPLEKCWEKVGYPSWHPMYKVSK